MIFFTSDLHFGHKAIIGFCNRPYVDVKTMDKKLIENWNSVVTDEDEVYVLGDFSWTEPAPILRKLKGKKHLILGNHDGPKVHRKCFEMGLWESISIYKELKHGNKRYILFHYPIFDWNGRFRKSIHLFGHTHKEMPELPKNSYHVGVDSNFYYPISIEEINKKLIDNSQYDDNI